MKRFYYIKEREHSHDFFRNKKSLPCYPQESAMSREKNGGSERKYGFFEKCFPEGVDKGREACYYTGNSSD